MITTQQADKLIRSGRVVKMTTTHNEVSNVVIIARDRRHIELVVEGSNNIGKMDRCFVASLIEK